MTHVQIYWRKTRGGNYAKAVQLAMESVPRVGEQLVIQDEDGMPTAWEVETVRHHAVRDAATKSWKSDPVSLFVARAIWV